MFVKDLLFEEFGMCGDILASHSVDGDFTCDLQVHFDGEKFDVTLTQTRISASAFERQDTAFFDAKGNYLKEETHKVFNSSDDEDDEAYREIEDKYFPMIVSAICVYEEFFWRSFNEDDCIEASDKLHEYVSKLEQ